MNEILSNTKRLFVNRKVVHYKGSLDFPCDYCESNSYNNFHFMEGEKIRTVICKDCLNKIKEVKG